MSAHTLIIILAFAITLNSFVIGVMQADIADLKHKVESIGGAK